MILSKSLGLTGDFFILYLFQSNVGDSRKPLQKFIHLDNRLAQSL
jgi:hypothetical protein